MTNESDELETLGHEIQAGLCCHEKLSPCCLHLHATKPPFHTEENHLSAQDGPGRFQIPEAHQEWRCQGSLGGS